MPHFSGEFVCPECKTSFDWKATPCGRNREKGEVVFANTLWKNVASCYENDLTSGYTITIYCPKCIRHYPIQKHEEER